MPAYNEERTIEAILEKIIKIKFECQAELIVVDDCSTDKTKEILLKVKQKYPEIKLLFHEKNKGKGSAVKTGLKHATGDIIAIQDADLEYKPNNINDLIKPILNNKFEVVYGSRFLRKEKKGYSLFYLGNWFLSLITSILYFSKITDMETCYKVFKKEVINNIKLNCQGFEFEPEITAKILKKGYKIKELPIDYQPRTITEGKKIKVADGLVALWYLIKYRFV